MLSIRNPGVWCDIIDMLLVKMSQNHVYMCANNVYVHELETMRL